MSEETQETTNDGTWSGLKKTIIGTVTTVVAGGGVWVSTLLFGGHSEEKAETKTEQAAPVINVNVQQNQENKQKTEAGGTTVIHEKEIVHDAAPAQQAPAPKPKQDDSW
jgi:flagellar basal body-associated protein FliL